MKQLFPEDRFIWLGSETFKSRATNLIYSVGMHLNEKSIVVSALSETTSKLFVLAYIHRNEIHAEGNWFASWENWKEIGECGRKLHERTFEIKEAKA